MQRFREGEKKNMNTLISNDNIDSETFIKCFVKLENVSDDFISNPRFICTVWNQPKNGELNIRSRWQFSFGADSPFKAMENGYNFVLENIKRNFNMSYDECLKLRNEINEKIS